jgi:hypothetical protein
MFKPLNVFNLDGYAVDCFRHNHSTSLVMPLNVFNLDGYAVDCFGITIQLSWLCR